MRQRFGQISLILSLIAFATGCIVHDQNTTLVINSDGSAEVQILRSNIRSIADLARAESQERDYRTSIDDQTHDDFRRIRESGSELQMSLWLREEVPMSHALVARIPDERALLNFATLKDADGNVVIAPSFDSDGAIRRLSLRIAIDPDSISAPQSAAATFEEFKRERALAISDLRVCVAEGIIEDASGFIVARDGRSALLDEDQVKELILDGNGEAEIYIQWKM